MNWKAKKKKPKRELEAMIWDRCLEAGMNLQSVTVSPSEDRSLLASVSENAP